MSHEPTAAEDAGRAEFWSARYREGTTPWDLGGPAPPLVRVVETLPLAECESVLVPGCGVGHDAAWLAGRGHEVVAVDFAPEPVRQLAARGLPRLTVVVADLFALPEAAAGPYDLVVEHTCYCAIPPSRREEYARVVHDMLRPGGRLVALFWAHGRPGGPPFTTDEAEIRRVFGKRFETMSMEVPGDSVAARAGQEILGVFRRA